MAPSNKRKRPDRQYSQDDQSSRPSPHRPDTLGLAHHGKSNAGRGGRGGSSRRQSRQGPHQNSMEGMNAVPLGSRNNAQSPSVLPPQTPQQTGTPAADSSRTGTPLPTAMAQTRQRAGEVPRLPPAPYAYDHLTDEVIASWQETGRQLMLSAVSGRDEMTVSVVLQELVRSSLKGRMEPGDVGSVIQQMISERQQHDVLDVRTMFLNTISLLDEPDSKRSPAERAALRTLLAAAQIDPELVRQELDIPLLKDLALVRDQFDRMRNRKTTNILYRQANFNLLREETEGYAKLLTEYFNTAQAASDNRDDPYIAVAAFQRVKALVGAFDLDVGRVLDITLDISANLLVKAYDFFVKFYRCSSWWPEGSTLDNVKWEEDEGFSGLPPWALPDLDSAVSVEHFETDYAERRAARDIRFWNRVREVGLDAYSEIGARRIVDFDTVAEYLNTDVPPQLDSQRRLVNEDKRTRTNENRKYMRETRLLPPSGNSDAAQLLGFKLRYYASPARDEDDKLPENLIHLAALLIKIGFVSLRDLYPHLYPPDDQMQEERSRLEKVKAEKEAKDRPGGGLNALAKAAALTDDTVPVVRNLRSDKERSGGATPSADRKDDTTRVELPAPQNQKVMILRALLLTGAIPEALFILGRFPWLAEVDLELHPILLRVIKQMLSKIIDEVRPLRNREGLDDVAEQLTDTSQQMDGKMTFSARQMPRPTKWLSVERIDEKEGREFRFYYSDWLGTVPVCQTSEDVILLCNTFMGFVGVKIGQDAVLLGTLLRLAKGSLTNDSSDSNQSSWLDLMKRLLVPALSLSKHNPNLTQELYELLMVYPITVRYNIYAEWFTGKTSRLSDIRIAFDHNKAEVKDVLRRVTNENSKKMGRALGKVALSSPGVVMMFMINQLESYSNMIPSLVECTKYFSMLAYDVLTWCLINSLSAQGRDRIQADGMLTSSWLQALSHFVASLFARYPHINPAPILQYLASELCIGNSTDLEMLEQVLSEMAGIRSDIEFNDAQVTAMAGGEHLQAQVLLLLGDKRHARKNTAKRLMQALTESGLIGQTLIAIAQERQMYPHHESSKFMPLKVLGSNLDKIQQVFGQYLDVLKTNLTAEEFETAVPDISRLIGDFGLDPGIAFTIYRTIIAHRMTEVDEAIKQGTQEQKRTLSQDKPQINGDVKMMEYSREVIIHSDGAPAKLKIEPSIEADNDMPPLANANGEHAAIIPQASGMAAGESPWHPALMPLIESLPHVVGELANRVSISFYVTFWTLSQSDVVVFTESYNQEIDRLRSQMNEISRDRADNSSIAVKERERKKRALQETSDNLRAEVKTRIAAYTKISKRLSQKEKNHWFLGTWTRADLDARHKALLQDCYLPRSMMSSLDAHYSFLMVKMLHEKGTPGFSTMNLISQLFRKQKLAAVIFQCTALEAQNLGRFLNEILKYLASWHADKATYDKEAVGLRQKLPGFARRVDADGNPDDFLEYETFRRLMYNWHTFFNNALQMCFESGEYMHIRNGIIVLKAVHQVFPKLNFQGTNMVKQVTKLSEEDSRQDLKLMALSLLGQLKSREKQWVMPQAFRLNDPAKEGKPGSRAPSARPETPQPNTDTPKMNAAAPEFKPTAVKSADIADRKESAAGIEDGEVEDEKPTPAKGADSEMEDVLVPKTEQTSDAGLKPSSEVSTVERHPTPEPLVFSASEVKDSKRSEARAPSAPVQAAVNGQVEQDHSRPPSTQLPAGRQLHTLPSRPEAGPPNRPLPTPPAGRGSGRFFTQGDENPGHIERRGEARPTSRDHSPGTRGRANTPPAPSREPARDDRPRPGKDDSYLSSRRDGSTPSLHSRPRVEARDRPNGPTGPPSVQAPHPERGGFISSVVSAPPPQEKPQPMSSEALATQTEQGEDNFRVNPARMAQINGAASSRPDAREDRRHERGGAGFVQRAETRPSGRGHPVETPRESQGRHDQPSDLTPTGPRRGRLSQDLAHASVQQESSYGRLNGDQDVPSGPRAPDPLGTKDGRNFTAPHSATTSRLTEAQMPSLSAFGAQDSSATFRGSALRPPSDRHGSGSQLDRQPSSTSVPTTPGTETGFVHPSRMANVQQPPPIQTNLPPVDGTRTAASPTSAPPSGPRVSNRAPAGAPTGPSLVSTGPPAGPTSAVERARRGERQRANINATLQGASVATGPSGNNLSFRGASSRQSSVSFSPAANVASVQAIASPMEPPPSRRSEIPPRQDAQLSRPDSRTEQQQHHELFQHVGDAQAQEAGRSRRYEEDRSNRPHDSRNASRDTRPAHEPPRRLPHTGLADNRDKRGAPLDDRRPRDEPRDGPLRERRGPERGPRPHDMAPQRQPPGFFQGPPLGWENGSNARGPRRDGPEDGRRGGREGLGNEDFRFGRMDDERREVVRGPPRDDGPPDGRKRRHEEAPFDPTKRRRSGR